MLIGRKVATRKASMTGHLSAAMLGLLASTLDMGGGSGEQAQVEA
jgi:hypothetical protein